MAQLILNNLEPEIVEKLELRAKRLGTTAEKEASQLLRERLRDEEDPRVAETRAAKADEAGSDPRFVRRHGFLVFTGEITAEDIVDHRAIRDERIDSLLKDASQGRICHVGARRTACRLQRLAFADIEAHAVPPTAVVRGRIRALLIRAHAHPLR